MKAFINIFRSSAHSKKAITIPLLQNFLSLILHFFFISQVIWQSHSSLSTSQSILDPNLCPFLLKHEIGNQVWIGLFFWDHPFWLTPASVTDVFVNHALFSLVIGNSPQEAQEWAKGEGLNQVLWGSKLPVYEADSSLLDLFRPTHLHFIVKCCCVTQCYVSVHQLIASSWWAVQVAESFGVLWSDICLYQDFAFKWGIICRVGCGLSKNYRTVWSLSFRDFLEAFNNTSIINTLNTTESSGSYISCGWGTWIEAWNLQYSPFLLGALLKTDSLIELPFKNGSV